MRLSIPSASSTLVQLSLFLGLTATAPSAIAAPASHPVKPTIFFVPGAWHKPAAFDTIRGVLGSRGYPTAATSLVSAGTTDPTVGLYNDVAGVRADLKKLVDAGKDVVVVAHSYGGVVSSNAVKGLGAQQRHGKRGGVVDIVYLTAFAIPVGQTLLETLGGVYPDWWEFSADGKFFIPIDPIKVFYADVDPKIAAAAAAQVVSEPLEITVEATNYAPWLEEFDVGYIFTEQDQALPPAVQHSFAAQFPEGSFTASVNTSHSPFLSQPEQLATVLEQAIRHATKN